MLRLRALQVFLVLVGLLFLAAIYPVATSLLAAGPASEGPMMLSLYFTLGIFLLIAVRNPAAHRSLIAFTAWSSFAHAAVMLWQSLHDAGERTHLLPGSGALVVIGVVLLALAPARQSGKRSSAAAA